MSTLDDEMRSIIAQRQAVADNKRKWSAVRFVDSRSSVVCPPIDDPAAAEFVQRANRRGGRNHVLCRDPDDRLRHTGYSSIEEAIATHAIPPEPSDYLLRNHGWWAASRERRARVARNRAAAPRLIVRYGWDITLWSYYADGDVVGKILLFEDRSWVPMTDVSSGAGDLATGGPDAWQELLKLKTYDQRRAFTLSRALAAALVSIEGSTRRR